MGPGTLIAAQSSGATFHELGVASAVFSVPVFLGVGIAAERGRRLVGVGLAVLSGLVLWGSIWIANLIFGTAPAGALGAAVTLGLHLLFHRLRGSRMSGSRAELRAIAPYGLLLGGVLLASVILRGTDVDDTAWRYLASPALWLAVATVFTLRGRRGQLPGALRQAAGAWIHVGPATALFILLGAVMSVSGMSGQLATALAGIGGFYLFLVPFIGGTGGFITGSNSGANAMFAGPQAQAAQTLGASVLSVSAVQNVSASALTLAAPARIELAVRLCPDQPPRQPVFRQILTTSAGILLVLATLTVVSG